jgi:hypothetical protein
LPPGKDIETCHPRPFKVEQKAIAPIVTQGTNPLWLSAALTAYLSSLNPSKQILLPTALIALMSAVRGSPQVPDAAGVEFFEQKIRPIFVEHCYKCHSHEAEKIKGGFLLDTHEGLLKGGDTGPAIVPGEPEQSLLIKAVRYTDENLQMPPKGKRLSPDQVAALEAWVRMGATDPRTSKGQELSKAETIAANARAHWAFQPIKQPPIPEVKNKRWVQSPLDAFVLCKLEAKGLSPSAQADKRTLIRRVTFDLVGLPPTPDEVAAFIGDRSPDAFAKLVDRLLGSPQYGERWGRYWLDVARYADTKGYVFEEERRYPYSYTYRDYVIRAFNEDLPYDQFICQQIAADLLPLGEDKRPLAALGYLTLGRRFLNNIHDIIDDRIDVVCRGMMGLTVACARCHDHKYDPIPSKDYYSLYGVFASSTEPEQEPLLEGTGQGSSLSKAREEYLAERKKREEERASFKESKEQETRAKLHSQAADYLLAAHDAQLLTNKSEIDNVALKRQLDPGVLQRWMTSLETWSKSPHAIFSPWFAFSRLETNDFATKTKELSSTFSASTNLNPLVATAFATNTPATLKDVAALYGKLLSDADHQTNAADNSALAALRQILYADDAPPNLPAHELHRLFDVPTSQKLRELQRKIDELDATHPGAPARAMALVDKSSPATAYVFVRGNPDNRGPEVPRQFPEVLAGHDRKPFQKGSGRLELADAIASTNNPLTARVIVNRIWFHHFGAGLVKTPSDFGLRSDPPTNPELLDYLADRFMNQGWSIKKLHREIMLSSTYQQSSDNNQLAARIDPNNQLLWRMNRQRLDFEAMRDSLLDIAGKLDLTAGGHAVDITSEPYSTRRTIYGHIDRQNLPGLFRTFDFANPDSTSPQRFFTTVPQQALFLMNSPFVVQQARHVTERPDFKALRSEDERIRFLYELAFQREPGHQEIEFAHQFFQSQKQFHPSPSASAWQYGYGELDEAAGRVKTFTLLPHFTGASFQGGPALPDPAIGWVILNESGGHPGDQQHAAIRRWIAPQDGVISIKGELSHGVYQGDGVRGRIISSRSGKVAEWLAHNNKAETTVEDVAVKHGDTIDFVTDCYQTVDHDSFGWIATVSFSGNDKTAGRKEWDTKKDFADSARLQHEPLSDWEKYAQVLLLANELVFVD